MSVRDDTVSAFQATTQILSLLTAQADLLMAQKAALVLHTDAYVKGSTYSLISELYSRVVNAINHNKVVQAKLLGLLDPFGDNYNYVPPIPIEITPFGIVEKTSGYSIYRHSAVAQNVVADVPYTVLNDRFSFNEAQKPGDIATFYDGDKLIGHAEDALLYRITMKVRPTDILEVASEIKIWIDYGAGIRLFEESKLLSGYNVLDPMRYQTSLFVGPTYAENGGQIVIQTDGAVEITEVAFLVTRLHKGF